MTRTARLYIHTLHSQYDASSTEGVSIRSLRRGVKLFVRVPLRAGMREDDNMIVIIIYTLTVVDVHVNIYIFIVSEPRALWLPNVHVTKLRDVSTCSADTLFFKFCYLLAIVYYKLLRIMGSRLSYWIFDFSAAIINRCRYLTFETFEYIIIWRIYIVSIYYDWCN